MTLAGDDCPFDGNGGSFVLQCGTFTIDSIHTDDKLLCSRDIVVKNVLFCVVVEILLSRR